MIIQRTTFTTELIVPNMPAGQEAIIQTSADLTIAFWNPAAEAYGAATSIENPGDVIACPNEKAKLTTATTASINITVLKQ